MPGLWDFLPNITTITLLDWFNNFHTCHSLDATRRCGSLRMGKVIPWQRSSGVEGISPHKSIARTAQRRAPTAHRNGAVLRGVIIHDSDLSRAYGDGKAG